MISHIKILSFVPLSFTFLISNKLILNNPFLMKLDFLNLQCPTEGYFNEDFTCNLTMSMPYVPDFYIVTLSSNSSFYAPVQLNFTDKKIEINLNFSEPGFYEVKVTENHIGTSSAKFINVTDFMVRKRLKVNNLDTTELDCKPGLVNLIYAAYGNKDHKCLTTDGTRIAWNFCHMKKNCNLTATEEVFGTNPCGANIDVFLYVQYNCSSK